MDSDDDQQFAKKNNGEALDIEEEEFDSDEDDGEDVDQMMEQQQQKKVQPQQQNSNKKTDVQQKSGQKDQVKGEKVENAPFDLAVEVNDSEEIDSEDDEEESNVNVGQPQQNTQQTNQQQPGQKLQQVQKPEAGEDDDDEDEKEVPGAYNPNDYANLQVSNDIKELFEYIQRYKPQKIDLDTKLKPFVPEYIPAVGEVDAFMKMPKPDGQKEDLGITVLDEPCLNHEDKTVLELKYVQSKNVVRAAPMDVDSIESADKKPKEISRWINSVQDLHKTRPPPTVNYTKQMPDYDVLMQEWNQEMEQAFRDISFPTPDIDMHTADYARLICAMVDIPSHKLANNKSVIESLHVLFTLFSEFRQNQHFQNQNQQQQPGVGSGDVAQF